MVQFLNFWFQTNGRNFADPYKKESDRHLIKRKNKYKHNELAHFNKKKIKVRADMCGGAKTVNAECYLEISAKL